VLIVRYGAGRVKKIRAASSIAALFFCVGGSQFAHGGVIPLPASIKIGEGRCLVNASTRLYTPQGDESAKEAADYLVGLWRRTNKLRLRAIAGTPPTESADACTIVFQRAAGLGDEGYRLEVGRQQITISAGTPSGLFYGAITLWQLLPAETLSGSIPAQIIDDSPRYPWRGLMLDSARHFQSPAFIRSMIDWMAWHKLNVLHWHLTDDQGWRLQVRRYPKLTSVGAWRGSSRSTYGGFYTQAQVAGIVRFAAQRHVQIIPEIDMPGHATAAVAAYPWLGSSAEPLTVSEKWGVHQHLFNLEPRTFEFLENVLGEVMQLFPSRYVHLGGDEAVKAEWNASAQVQARARELGIADAAGLQAYFTQRMARFLEHHGRRLVGWDEILTPGMPGSAVVMSWHGVTGAHDAAIAGNDTVLTPQPTLYFDRRQSNLAGEPPGRLEVSSLQAVYAFDPDVQGLDQAQQAHVLGVQANIWTEHIQSEKRVEWMALPRAAAVAEVAWSQAPAPTGRGWDNFLQRLVPMFARYRTAGLNYSDSVFGIAASVTRGAAPEVGVELANPSQLRSGMIRYSIDGSDPVPSSAAYVSTLPLKDGVELRAATFLNQQQASRIWSKRIDRHSGSRRNSHELQLCSERIGLLLEPAQGGASDAEPLAIDIMNPCWIYRDVDLSRPINVSASVASLPFNYEIGRDAAAIKVGDSRTSDGELELHVDGCDSPVLATLALPRAVVGKVITLPTRRIDTAQPGVSGFHDLCVRFARPRLDPMWALDWLEVTE
jgi:hexosaminidase